MSVTATAPIAVLADRLRWQIGNAPAWVAWTGKAPAAAIQSVYIYSPEEWQMSNPGPFVIIELGDDWSVNGGLNTWRHSGSFLVSVTSLVPDAYTDSPPDAYMDFLNHMGELERNLRTLNRGCQNWINVTFMRYIDPPVRTTPEYRKGGVGDWVQCVLQVGVEQGEPL